MSKLTCHILNAFEAKKAEALDRLTFADRLWSRACLAVSFFLLIGSIWGIVRIRELRHEQKCLEALSKWNQLGIAIKQEACRAIVDHDHPTRGLVALSNAIYDAIDAQLKGGVK